MQPILSTQTLSSMPISKKSLRRRQICRTLGGFGDKSVALERKKFGEKKVGFENQRRTEGLRADRKTVYIIDLKRIARGPQRAKNAKNKPENSQLILPLQIDNESQQERAKPEASDSNNVKIHGSGLPSSPFPGASRVSWMARSEAFGESWAAARASRMADSSTRMDTGFS